MAAMPSIANLAGMAANNARTAEGYRAGAAANAPTPEGWQFNKDLIEQLYVMEDRPLKEVRQLMEDRSFLATERMFKQRLKEWGFDRKKVKAAEWRYMLRITLQRRVEGKESAFQVHGKMIVWSNIRKHLKRKKKTEDEFLATGPDPEGIEGAVICFTPMGSPLPPMPQTLTPNGPVSAYPSAFSPESGASRPSLDWHGSSPPYPYHAHAYPDQPQSPTGQFSSGISSFSTTAVSSRRPSMLASPANEPDSVPDKLLQVFTLFSIRQDQTKEQYVQQQPFPKEDVVMISRLLTGTASSGDDLSSFFSLINLDPESPPTHEELASKWIVCYFQACIAQCQGQNQRRDHYMAQGAKALSCMLSRANPYLLTGGTLLISILYYHGHKQICEQFLKQTCQHIRKQAPRHGLLILYDYMSMFFPAPEDNSNGQEDNPSVQRDKRKDHTEKSKDLCFAWEQFKLSWGENEATTLAALYYYGFCLEQCELHQQAAEKLRLCLARSEEHIGKSHLLTIWTLATLARTLMHGPVESKTEAIEMQIQAIDRCRNVMPEEHPYSLELTWKLAGMYQETGNLRLAEQFYAFVLAGHATVFGPDHETTLTTKAYLIYVLRMQDKSPESCDILVKMEAREARGEHAPALGMTI